MENPPSASDTTACPTGLVDRAAPASGFPVRPSSTVPEIVPVTGASVGPPNPVQPPRQKNAATRIANRRQSPTFINPLLAPRILPPFQPVPDRPCLNQIPVRIVLRVEFHVDFNKVANRGIVPRLGL